jgi:MFS family permease
MNATDNELLHRLLDEAFAPHPVTAESLDLKQEVRANLTARAAELQAGGATPSDAARTAVGELGDIGLLLESGEPAAERGSWVAEEKRNRVRPNPAFAVRVAILAGLLAVDALLLVLQFAGVIWRDELWIVGQLVAAIIIVGVIVSDSLRQETTTHYPVPRGRAIGFGVASSLIVAGAATLFPLSWGVNTAWVVILGAFVVVGIGLFTFLGVTATNRAKPWVVRLQASQPNVGDRFEKDPAAAARFGIYTVVIFAVAFIAFVVLSFTIGWAWSWLALVGGFLVMMLVLARMLFGSSTAKGQER